MDRIYKTSGPIKFLALPYPYKAWLCISNDPDNTIIKDWHELDQVIWKDLELPFSDALFLTSVNCNLPDQVNLKDHPFILNSHPHDTLHFWGDYQHSRKTGFDREDALTALQTLEALKFKPRVWVDHSNHRANFMHGAYTEGAKPVLKDASGIVYKNYNYTLDLAYNAGVRYVWNGDITPFIGQDIPIPYSLYLKELGMPTYKKVLYSLGRKLIGNSKLGVLFPPAHCSNKQLWSYNFPDGSTFYSFIRYGNWSNADIDGLANVISPVQISRLIHRQGTCIAYTHLGKRRAGRESDKKHIPPETTKALLNLKKQNNDKRLMLSSVSEMLDYLVIRNNLIYNPLNNAILFKPDGIRYKHLSVDDINGYTFSFKTSDSSIAKSLTLLLNEQQMVGFEILQPEQGLYSVVVKN